MRSNSKRVVEAAANYIDSLYQEGKRILLHTFDGQTCLGTIREQEIQYFPLKVTLTVIDDSTQEHQTFDLCDIVSIQPSA
ncbi:MAG TPA: hypothetical protein VN922_05170 [Bacteroidia bacterium]|jgi:hypothetical protein|nr:hypothetical protein [Bacteroidia bacterium]